MALWEEDVNAGGQEGGIPGAAAFEQIALASYCVRSFTHSFLQHWGWNPGLCLARQVCCLCAQLQPLAFIYEASRAWGMCLSLPAPWRLRQEGCLKFQTTLGYKATVSLPKKEQNGSKNYATKLPASSELFVLFKTHSAAHRHPVPKGDPRALPR